MKYNQRIQPCPLRNKTPSISTASAPLLDIKQWICCISYHSHNKQWFLPETALISWCLLWRKYCSLWGTNEIFTNNSIGFFFILLFAGLLGMNLCIRKVLRLPSRYRISLVFPLSLSKYWDEPPDPPVSTASLSCCPPQFKLPKLIPLLQRTEAERRYNF
jgi:hypothetical protein